MREGGWPGAERLEHLDLRGAIRDVILAADDVGYVQVDVIDDAGQETVVGSLGAGDLIGADDENAHGPRKTMVRAATDVQIFSFELTRA